MKSRVFFFQSLLQLFFPYHCCGCGTDLLTEEILFCLWCQASAPFTGFEYHSPNPIEKIFFGRANIEAASAHFYFTRGSSVQHSLHLLKYKNRKDIGIYFGRNMGMALKKSGRFTDCDLIMPLPLFAGREKKRGYNQSALIAKGMAGQLNLPVCCEVISRIKKTDSQTRKSRIERWKNMESSFRILHPDRIAGKHILLVDDVITTGASLEACAGVLLAVTGVRVSIACLAHTVSS